MNDREKSSNQNQILQMDAVYDESAERAVLGTILYDFSYIPTILNVINEDDFFDNTYKELFSAIIEFYLESKLQFIDKTLFYEFVRSKNYSLNLTDEFLESLVLEAVPDDQIITHIAELIKEKATQRKLAQLVAKASSMVGKVSSNDLVSLIQDDLSNVVSGKKNSQYVDVYTVAENVVQAIEGFVHRKELVTGVSSGIPALDIQTTGFHDSDLIILAARPGMGKSALMLSMAYNMALKGNKVAVFSLEMTKEQLVTRLVSSIAKIPMHNLRSGLLTDNDLERLKSAVDQLKDLPIYIDDTPSLSISELRVRARKMKTEKDINLLAVDYLQLLRARERNNRQEEVAEISRNLKALAKELKIPVLALAQLSRQSEQRSDKRPQLSDLRESGQIEQDADLIMFLHRPEYYKKNPLPEEKNMAELIIAKQRQGPTGIIKLAFLSQFVSFAPIDMSALGTSNDEDATPDDDTNPGDDSYYDLDVDF
ncbi:MAG TPA: replicative DNA helicase [Thermodesulfobium narugense]|nr:replicative DNA helicase [Thermodesulfobium narugense]